MDVGPFILVVSNGVLQNSSDVFSILDPDRGGRATFSVPLNATGLQSDPTTHWAARTLLAEETYNALANMSVPQFKTYVDQVVAQRGRTPVGSVTAFKNNLQILDGAQDFDAVMTTLGLKRVRRAGAFGA